MTMRLKEKELAAVGISLAAGCRPCTDYHLKAVRQAKAGDEEISRARRIAIGVRGRAAEIMAVHGLASGPAPYPLSQDRTALLIAIGAAFTVNCTTSLEHYLALAPAAAIDQDELAALAKLATFIRGKAISHVEALVPVPVEAAA
ncbi:MAG TPA: carboxymuconolactone decarboxylase family protein [Alphaproteobacteria bacterium]|jgi:AhpD family alkylhydroperoxidase|nr:carboxymuconolactone decarboxylase family protein [Alphaproteobacteria bacterium]HJM50532.1 carboxymuconolactone decarboxylase family protein [Alphaproteobacteria bacterium]|tara:strand:- start:252 stop:686 length:435 start_codon:yes stop_codon:yes gene_type:complete